jgi:hypothetical protein
MLADHGVHALALAWTISEDLEPLAWTGERATVRVGSGRLELSLSRTAARRGTTVDLRVPRVCWRWEDERSELLVGGRALRTRRVPALSDRLHVDSLYGAFYRELEQRLGDPAWRRLRTREALTVGAVLVELRSRRPALR